MTATTEPDRAQVPLTGLLIGEEERAAVERVLRSGMLAQGPEVAAFEEEFSAHVAGRACVAVNSGTSALLLSLLALGIGPGDEVIVPSFSFAATANAVFLAGAEPVFADIEPEHFCLDPDAVLAAITPRTAAVVPVHLYGHPAAMGRLEGIARGHGLAVVEDAAQAHLATRGGRPVGTFGAAAAFSFYPTKNMTCGEGGMVVCADDATARTVRLLRNQGMERRYANELRGYNMRMTDLHAAIGRVQLRRLPTWTRVRRANAQFLGAALASLDAAGVLSTPRSAPAAAPAWHQYTVRVPRRDEVAADLADLGVAASVFYPVPIHRLPAYDLDLDLPRTEAAAREVLSLPVHPALSDADLGRITTGLTAAVTR
ncbi:DegT/DnrJ/EryC1/StrS family aminotransferase [Actinomycetospora sp. CA-101289]|uniref:DegT/DnrJ/EryC1/StrS family aminotransferase n=1 Tax=Actinomycetospora sp. CA-101289 TaxID=3239893 RepID=UPI003D984CCE